MKLFSQRKGLKPSAATLQLDSMDAGLRSRLWDVVSETYWLDRESDNFTHYRNGDLLQLVRTIWHRYFKRPVDTISDDFRPCLADLRSYFFNCEWNEVYDFLEFLAKVEPTQRSQTEFTEACNQVLEQELSAYRFIGSEIVPISSHEETEAIEQALQISGKLTPIGLHFERAVALFADRKKPDYRNSIKESISAVEAICRLIGSNPKATLGDAIKQLESRVSIHPALKDAFGKLYGYTSDADGIRHSLLDESKLRPEDAKYMLVSCAAFVNYLVAKSAEVGITF